MKSEVKTHLPIGIVAEGCLLGTASTGGCVFTLKLYIKGAELGTLVGIFMVPESQNTSERRHINQATLDILLIADTCWCSPISYTF